MYFKMLSAENIYSACLVINQKLTIVLVKAPFPESINFFASPGMVGCGEVVVYLMSLGHLTDIGNCCPCSRLG